MEPDEYPAWVYPFAALVIFVLGSAGIYFSLAFVNLELDPRFWSGLDRVVAVVLVWLWARYVVQSAEEARDDGQE